MKFIAYLSDLPEGKITPVHLEKGEMIILIKRGQAVYALDAICPHMGGPLEEGSIEGGCITCPWHGWQFDIGTGESITSPGEDLKKYPLKIEGNKIYLIDE